MMKRFICALFLLVLVSPAWAAKKITVGQLEDLLRSLQRDKKTDAEVATSLKQIELSEQLTRATMNSLIGLAPGPYTTEQIYVLEARSADLIPPQADLPTTPAPDSTAQKEMLARAAAWVNGTYNQLPALSAEKTTVRFQDNVEAVSSSSGITGSATEVTTNASFSKPAAFVHYINSAETEVTFEHGAEVTAKAADKTAWGANGMIAIQEPALSLNAVFRAAQEAGTLQWLRWELINGKPAGVFAFEVPRKRSKLDIKVCCFPNINQAGIATFYTATSAAAMGGGGSGGGGVTGNYQTTTEWHDYKSTPPYHGELFIEPDTGIVVRLITEAEFKATEVVHQVDTRIDFGPVSADGKTLVAPVKSFVNTVVVPGGESGAGSYTTRCTLFTSEYSKYHAAGAK